MSLIKTYPDLSPIILSERFLKSYWHPNSITLKEAVITKCLHLKDHYALTTIKPCSTMFGICTGLSEGVLVVSHMFTGSIPVGHKNACSLICCVCIEFKKNLNTLWNKITSSPPKPPTQFLLCHSDICRIHHLEEVIGRQTDTGTFLKYIPHD